MKIRGEPAILSRLRGRLLRANYILFFELGFRCHFIVLAGGARSNVRTHLPGWLGVWISEAVLSFADQAFRGDPEWSDELCARLRKLDRCPPSRTQHREERSIPGHYHSDFRPRRTRQRGAHP